MSKRHLKSRLDPADDAPVLTRQVAARAQIADGDRVLREAEPPLKRGRGRPPKSADERKRQVTLRLSPEVLTAARKTGPGWQARVDDVLRTVFVRNRNASARELGEAISNTLKSDTRVTSRNGTRGFGHSREHNDQKKRA